MVLTMRKTLKSRGVNGVRLSTGRVHIPSLIFRDGSIFFIAACLVILTLVSSGATYFAYELSRSC